jgi:hypothetical protein
LFMHSRRFDTLARFVSSTSVSSTRRRSLRRVPTLPVAGALTTLVAGLDEHAAAHPVERVQKRRDKHRQRARRRQDNRHDRRTRDNGPEGSGAPCGSSCPACQTCRGARCVADGSQNRNCCGTPNAGTWCQAGACVRATGTFADCRGLCANTDPPSSGKAHICGQDVRCPTCDGCGCGQEVCNGIGEFGPGHYCVMSDFTRGCSPLSGDGCLTGEVCCNVICQVACTA